MKRGLLLLGVFLGLLSCKEKLIEPPKDLIPEAEMTEILYDLALINGIRTTNPTTLDTYEIETMPYIYEKYDIDSIQFVQSDQYYASVPVIYQRMYQSITDRIEAHIAEIDKARERKNDSARARNKRIRDSLSKKAISTKSPVPVKK
jgi:hypothetical protein